MDRGRAMVPNVQTPARRTKVWAVGLIIVLAAVATGVAFLIMHLTKKKEGAPGNWTETQIDTMTNALLVVAPMQLKEIMAIEDLREVFRCVVKEISLEQAYDEDCSKTKSCKSQSYFQKLLEKCLGSGEKGRWSAATKDMVVNFMEKKEGMSRVVALCAVDAISNSYSFSDYLNGKASASSTDLVSNIIDSCSLKGYPVDGPTGSFAN
jgi:hypothetical protein